MTIFIVGKYSNGDFQALDVETRQTRRLTKELAMKYTIAGFVANTERHGNHIRCRNASLSNFGIVEEVEEDPVLIVLYEVRNKEGIFYAVTNQTGKIFEFVKFKTIQHNPEAFGNVSAHFTAKESKRAVSGKGFEFETLEAIQDDLEAYRESIHRGLNNPIKRKRATEALTVQQELIAKHKREADELALYNKLCEEARIKREQLAQQERERGNPHNPYEEDATIMYNAPVSDNTILYNAQKPVQQRQYYDKEEVLRKRREKMQKEAESRMYEEQYNKVQGMTLGSFKIETKEPYKPQHLKEPK